MKAIAVCPVCEINIYEAGKLGKPVSFRGRTVKGYPNPVSMPCGINREPEVQEALKAAGVPPDKELTKEQSMRCPFETKEQQDKIDMQKAVGIFSGNNNHDYAN
jgi:hypothetical protein